MNPSTRTLNILGTRGIPAAHGGFETFAEQLSKFMVNKGWNVNVYCQDDSSDSMQKSPYHEDAYENVNRVHVGVRRRGPIGTMEFDWKCIMDVIHRPGLDLVLGYNTAVFSTLQLLRGRTVVMNMDGVEWKRAKWSTPAKAWFRLNEFVGAHTCTLPIADHPMIAKHLEAIGCRRSKIIPYGADKVEYAEIDILDRYHLIAHEYFISICRIEPENSVLEIVSAFSSKTQSKKLVVLGTMDASNDYHNQVLEAASEMVVFPGAIYDRTTVNALRLYSTAYIHGHQVGGTNPSLVEALGCGCAVIAHDNVFNRWVAGDSQLYFRDSSECAYWVNIEDSTIFQAAGEKAREQHQRLFQWKEVLEVYFDTFQELLQERSKPVK